MCDECEKLKYQLIVAFDALKTVRLNTRSNWDRAVIDKSLRMINKPEDFDWSHLKHLIERNKNGGHDQYNQ